jgi:hypothetical protein
MSKLIHTKFLFCFLMSCQLHIYILFQWIWGSHSGGYKSAIFWDITPCSLLTFEGICRLHLLVEEQGEQETSVQAAWRRYVRSTETSVDFQWTTWCYIPETRTLHIISSFVFKYNLFCFITIIRVFHFSKFAICTIWNSRCLMWQNKHVPA